MLPNRGLEFFIDEIAISKLWENLPIISLGLFGLFVSIYIVYKVICVIIIASCGSNKTHKREESTLISVVLNVVVGGIIGNILGNYILSTVGSETGYLIGGSLLFVGWIM